MNKIKSIVDEFKSKNSDKSGPRADGPVTIWLPVGYKEKYIEIQELSKSKKNKFSEVLREVICEVIDSVYDTK